MVIRFLIRFLTNNEHLVQRLSESYPIRRAARVLVSLYFRGQNAIQDSGVTKKISNNNIKSFVARFKSNLREEIETAKKELEKKRKS